MTNTNLTTFNFNTNTIRTQTIDGKPYFCLTDCCKALGIHNSRTTVKLSEDGVGKTYIGVKTGKKADGTPAIQQVEMLFINEPNLYRLIFRSNKPQAQAFADWVYNDVLPSIRKTGAYISPAQAELALQPVQYDITQDKQALKVIGGMMKRCCASAVREELSLAGDENTIKFISLLLDSIVNNRVKSIMSSRWDDIKHILTA
jgi:prophage antirepressor-like protein